MSKSLTAALIIIGNEILSGRTQDKNLNFLANELGSMGIQLMEVRVIPDIESTIIDTVNTLRNSFSYVFTTGGIGPTHDDITSASVAKALNMELYRHPEAVERLRGYYASDDELTDARLKMADVPSGAILIDNPVTSAPGYKVENVFVLAGIPKIMQAMFEACKPYLENGSIVHSKEVSAFVSESQIASRLADIQGRYPEVEIGSYPFKKDNQYGVSVVLRSQNTGLIDQVQEEVEKLMHG
tara:strand:- start:1404 stop:2126 length:723 start_codon:yes stop_codon:yes gene_type:complete